MNKATNIQYLKGDATSPAGEGNKIIAHICNDVGAWGKGFVLALSKKWQAPEFCYRKWHELDDNFTLGEVQLVQVNANIWVVNIIGQRNIKKDEQGRPPIRYEAVASGLQKLSEFAEQLGASVHMPRIGCGLAGGTWDKIEPLIITNLIKKNIAVTVYDLT